MAESVLVLDDNETIKRGLKLFLEKKGFEVEVGQDGEQGLAFFAETGRVFDLIVADILMPKVDGLEFGRQLRARGIDTPIIFISGHFVDRTQHEIASITNAELLPKPFRMKALSQLIQSVLG